MKISRFDVISILLLFVVSIFPLLMTNAQVRHVAHYIFAFHLIVVLSSVLIVKKPIAFMPPEILTVLYIEFSFLLGAFAFYNGFVLRNTKNYANYLEWEYINTSVAYFLICSTLIYSVDAVFRKKILRSIVNYEPKKHSIPFVFFILCILTSPFLMISLDAFVFGGSGDFSIIPKSLTVLVFIYIIASRKIKFRFFYYALAISLFASISVDSKREAVFLIFPILLIESMYSDKVINFGSMLKLLSLVISLIVLIILMSIVRGYGNFVGVTNIATAIPFMYQYIKLSSFLPSFFNNIEVNYTFYHSMQALEYIQRNFSLLTFGLTITKAIFVLVPRSLWPDKLKSIIEIYTNYHAPVFREAGGGAWPIIYMQNFFGILVFLVQLLLRCSSS